MNSTTYATQQAIVAAGARRRGVAGLGCPAASLAGYPVAGMANVACAVPAASTTDWFPQHTTKRPSRPLGALPT